MATGRGAMEAYLDVSPMQAWDRDSWDEYDGTINVGFHSPAIHFTPLLNYVSMPPGANTWYTDNEMLRGHVNHSSIGLRQRFIDAMYVDTRRRKLVSEARYGNKVQVHEIICGPAKQFAGDNRVNSENALRKVIPSQAPFGEGVETTCLQA